jgi:hypothetical protein
VRYQTPTSLWSLAFWGLAVAGILAVCVGLVYLMRVAFASFTASPVTAHYPVRPQVFTTPNGMSGWSVRVGPQGQHVPTPAVAGDKVIVGGGFTSCSLYAFDSRHGHPKWTAPLRENGPSAAAVWNDRVAVNTESCTLYLLHTDAGAELWRDTIGPSLTSQPAITDDRVYAASPRGGEYSLTCRRLQDGKEAWSAAIPADLISAPVCHGNRVYFSTYDGGLHCYRATNGRRVWAQQANATSAPYIADGWVYVTTRENVTAPDGTSVPYEGVCSFDAGLGRPNPRPLWRRRADYLSHDLQSRSPYAQAASAEDAAVGVEERIRDWGETPYVSPYSSPGPSGPRQTWWAWRAPVLSGRLRAPAPWLMATTSTTRSARLCSAAIARRVTRSGKCRWPETSQPPAGASAHRPVLPAASCTWGLPLVRSSASTDRMARSSGGTAPANRFALSLPWRTDGCTSAPRRALWCASTPATRARTGGRCGVGAPATTVRRAREQSLGRPILPHRYRSPYRQRNLEAAQAGDR